MSVVTAPPTPQFAAADAPQADFGKNGVVSPPNETDSVIAALLLGWAGALYTLKKGQTDLEKWLVFEDLATPAVEVLELTFRK